MTRRRFEWMLRARGTDLDTWPESEHDAALALMRQDADACQLLADMLAQEEAPTPDPAALSRVQDKVRTALAPLTPFWRGVVTGALAACVAAGLWLGVGGIEAEAVIALTPTVQATSPGMVLAAFEP